ncbi:MAG: allantoate amidohydrolase [Novosphingobium sp.]|uniref:allantoate amidohydrolase n=1 Tax=Novosphingobium sp. TaxID=1874826 RepID=UPI0012C28CC7|nr:allantoate amidohydrolase [Novosphingobium sp.]MPS68559.1 allantoate amidohydrolase [Novosphingobium sp.]
MVETGGARAVARCDALGAAPYSELEQGLYRGYLTPAYHATVDLVGAWMVDAGMDVDLDAAANLHGRYEGEAPGAPALVIGSHLDSVRDGGCYDGPLGVMLGIECVAALNEQGRRLPFAIEVYGFGDEEGSRFPAAMLTSRAVAGTLDVDLGAIADAEGVSMEVALGSFKTDYDVVTAKTPTNTFSTRTYRAARRAPEDIVAYLEAHIEQGPALEAEGLALGTVTGIASQLRYAATVRGMAGHAGTSSMPLRRDALAGAAEMVLAIEEIARADGSDLVATVGRLEAMPGAANVIPGEVRFTIDVRSGEAARRDRAAREILSGLEQIASKRGLVLDLALVHDLPASPCDPVLMDLLDAAMADAGQPVRRLVSGAGHDAMVMASLCPTAMLFIRCKDGVSHNPAEHVEPADADAALRVMRGFIEKLGQKHLGDSFADQT